LNIRCTAAWLNLCLTLRSRISKGQFPHMTKKLPILILFSFSVCCAQSAPTPAAMVDRPDRSTNQPLLVPANPERQNTPTPEERPDYDRLVQAVNGPDAGNSNTLTAQSPPRRATPIFAKSEFEMFADDAAGHPLTVYGRQLFDEVPTTFAPMDHIPVPAEYVIGPGDELMIRAWGKIELQSRLTVDRNGQIFIPKVGTLMVAGLRFSQLEGNIHSAIGSIYKDFDLNVTMGQLRSIQIFILGSARQPGVYTVSSLSTLINALFASGGPSATGTMRRIQLRRANQVVTEFDIYDLLRKGDKSCDAQLLPGDIIYIPPIGPQTAILGSVNEPGIYELKGETSVASVLKDGAGLSNLASVDRALLERVENHRRRQVDEFALDEAGLQRQLRDGDILRIFPISPRVENAVTLRGNVAQPGRYLWREGMRISDLIPTRDMLLTRDYWNQQNFLASTLPPPATNPLAQAQDGQEDISSPQNNRNGQLYAGLTPYPSAAGDRDRTIKSLPSQMHEYWDQPRPKVDTPARDAMIDVSVAGTEINWEYAAIERRDDNDLSTRIIPFNLGKAIDKSSTEDNATLRPGDVITIFTRKDVPLPQDKQAVFVRVGGEVNAPGVYRIAHGETLRDLVVRAGGLTSHSYLYASELTRASTRLAQEQELRVSAAQMQRELASRYASTSSLNPTNTQEQQVQLAAQQSLLTQLAAVHPTGRIVLDMQPDAGSIGDIPDFPLVDGDAYYIPARLGTVQVSGAVYNENAFRYQPGRRLSTYLKAAGGPTRQADVKRVFLIRADGTVVSRQTHHGSWRDSFGGLALLPGDAIVVPTKLKSPNSFIQQLPFLTQILSQAATTGAVIGVR
jgi:polysaccharide biosynthesis/export protein